MADRPLRSFLFVPATRPDRFEKAIASGADAAVIDLEDAVEPAKKADARAVVAKFFRERTAGDGGALRLVRVNGAGTPWHDDDIRTMAELSTVQGVMVPKVDRPEPLEAVASTFGTRPIFPQLETARGILNALAIVDAEAPLGALLFGAEDLTAEIGIPRTLDGEELLFARSRVVLAATAVGIDAIDAVFISIDAPDDFRRDAARAAALGFRGKMAIHPSQIPIIHDVFRPSADQIAWARDVVAAFDEAMARGDAVFRFRNQMIDRPVVERARRVLKI